MKTDLFIAILGVLLLAGCGGGANSPLPGENSTLQEINTTNLKLPKTGQTVSYQDGDDGYHQKGVTRSYTRDDGAQIVTDHVTGLMWQDDSSTIETKLWQDAIDYCESSQLGSFSDWRLPTIEELVSLIDFGKMKPSIDDIFQNINDKNYWSSTRSANNPAKIRYVSFEIGIVSVVSQTYQSYGGLRFRCVREMGERR